jgi:hypothetical protein
MVKKSFELKQWFITIVVCVMILVMALYVSGENSMDLVLNEYPIVFTAKDFKACQGLLTKDEPHKTFEETYEQMVINEIKVTEYGSTCTVGYKWFGQAELQFEFTTGLEIKDEGAGNKLVKKEACSNEGTSCIREASDVQPEQKTYLNQATNIIKLNVNPNTDKMNINFNHPLGTEATITFNGAYAMCMDTGKTIDAAIVVAIAKSCDDSIICKGRVLISVADEADLTQEAAYNILTTQLKSQYLELAICDEMLWEEKVVI